MGPTSKGKFCTKFGYLIVRKIIIFVAIRRHILGLKCTKFSAHTALESLQRSPSPLAKFKRPTFKGRGARQGKGRVKEGREEKGEEKGKGRVLVPPTFAVWWRPWPQYAKFWMLDILPVFQPLSVTYDY